MQDQPYFEWDGLSGYDMVLCEQEYQIKEFKMVKGSSIIHYKNSRQSKNNLP